MKYILMTLILVSCFSNDASHIKDAEMTSDPNQQVQKPAQDINTANSDMAQNGFVEENNECICTKEYKPVCGKNGKMYPNSCQAGCDGVKEFKDGPC